MTILLSHTRAWPSTGEVPSSLRLSNVYLLHKGRLESYMYIRLFPPCCISLKRTARVRFLRHSSSLCERTVIDVRFSVVGMTDIFGAYTLRERIASEILVFLHRYRIVGGTRRLIKEWPARSCLFAVYADKNGETRRCERNRIS